MKLDELRDEGWRRLLAAARRRLEATGGRLDGTIGLRAPTDTERRVVIGITGAHRSAAAGQLRVGMATLDRWLRDAAGQGLTDVLSELDSTPLRDRPAERRHEAAARADALAHARRSRHAGAAWFDAWLDELAGDGTLTRLVRRGGHLAGGAGLAGAGLPGTGLAGTGLAGTGLAGAVAVLERLPAEEVPLPVLAERTVGDTKALSGTPLSGLVLRALAAWQGVAPATSGEDERALWDAAGVIVDDLASQVLVLNLPARGGVVADWLTSAARAGLPFRLTLHQLRAVPVVPTPSTVFVCENPAVLRAAAGALGPRGAALVCAEGAASVACRRLVAACADAGANVLWRNDFDWPGLRMTAAALTRFGAAPWRMGAADYLEAAGGGDDGSGGGRRGGNGIGDGGSGALLRGAPATSPWQPELAEAMARTGRPVMEERLIPQLLDDLGA